MNGLFLIFSAVVPGLLLIWFFHSRDASPIPGRRLWATFAYGCVCTIPAIIVGLILGGTIHPGGAIGKAAFEAFIEAGLVEESSKLGVLLLYSLRAKRLNDPMDGLVYGATASLGFATLENILYVSGSGFGIAVVRALLSVPGHAFYGAILGYYVGQARLRQGHQGENPRTLILTGLFLAAVLHGLYDFGLMASPAFKGNDAMVLVCLGITLAAFIAAWRLTLQYIRRLQKIQHDRSASTVMISSASLNLPSHPGAPPAVTPPPYQQPSYPQYPQNPQYPQQPQGPYQQPSPPPVQQPPYQQPSYPQAPWQPAAPPPPPGSGVRWLLLIPGAGLASFGGMFTLVALAAPFLGNADTPASSIFAGGLLLGLPTLLLGLWLFWIGIRPNKPNQPKR